MLSRCDLPTPELNIALTSQSGRVLGRGDLVYPEWRTVVEHDGDRHRTSTRQYERDIHRLDGFRDKKWHVAWVRSRGRFVTPHETVARVATALRKGGWTG